MDSVSKERVGALSDGVFAIAATLLVLELAPPESGAVSYDVIAHWGRTMAGWLISFTMVAILWFDNHYLMARASRWTVWLAALTFVQLALVSLIPFGSNLITDYPNELAAALAFNGIMLANGLASAIAAHHLARTADVHAGPHIAPQLAHRSAFQIKAYLGIAAAAALAAWLHHPFMGVLFWAISPAIMGLRATEARTAAGSPARPMPQPVEP